MSPSAVVGLIRCSLSCGTACLVSPFPFRGPPNAPYAHFVSGLHRHLGLTGTRTGHAAGSCELRVSAEISS